MEKIKLVELSIADLVALRSYYYSTRPGYNDTFEKITNEIEKRIQLIDFQ